MHARRHVGDRRATVAEVEAAAGEGERCADPRGEAAGLRDIDPEQVFVGRNRECPGRPGADGCRLGIDRGRCVREIWVDVAAGLDRRVVAHFGQRIVVELVQQYRAADRTAGRPAERIDQRAAGECGRRRAGVHGVGDAVRVERQIADAGQVDHRHLDAGSDRDRLARCLLCRRLVDLRAAFDQRMRRVIERVDRDRPIDRRGVGSECHR